MFTTRVAMKRLYPAASSRSDADRIAELRRFEREVRTQRTLSEGHRGIMPIMGENFDNDPPFYIMPLASKTLRDVITRNPKGLATHMTAAILEVVCDAVMYAHSRRVYHRDLKPENILKLHRGWVVGDFGLCRDVAVGSTTFTQTNVGFGTVAYMAPEQYDNAHVVGPEADVFALGRILYHVLTGKSPSPYQHLDLLPAEYRDLVAIATAELPENRYPSVSEFELALGRSASTSRFGTVHAPRPSDLWHLGDSRVASASVSSGV
jgi:serine/threonine protein kinase